MLILQHRGYLRKPCSLEPNPVNYTTIQSFHLKIWSNCGLMTLLISYFYSYQLIPDHFKLLIMLIIIIIMRFLRNLVFRHASYEKKDRKSKPSQVCTVNKCTEKTEQITDNFLDLDIQEVFISQITVLLQIFKPLCHAHLTSVLVLVPSVSRRSRNLKKSQCSYRKLDKRMHPSSKNRNLIIVNLIIWFIAV